MMLSTFLDFIFGCHHSNLSRVFTIGRRSYRVCCGCGAQFEYSLERMVSSRRRTRAQGSLGVVKNAIHNG